MQHCDRCRIANVAKAIHPPGTVVAVAWGLMVAAWLLPPDRCTPPSLTRSLGREGLEPGGATGGMLASVTGSAVQSMAAPVKQSTCQRQSWAAWAWCWAWRWA